MSAPNAERSLVGALLAGYPDPEDALAIVRGPDFDDPNLETVWTAIATVVSTGKRVDPITVREALPKQGANLPDGPLFLANLSSEAPSPVSAMHYAEIVRSDATRRRLKTAGMRIVQMADQGLDVDQLADRARGEMETALDVAVTHDLQLLSAALPEVMDIAQRGHQTGLLTPWPGLDRMIRGLQPGRLIVVGARPGVGKSVMGANLALHVGAKHHKAVLFCSLEMPSVEVVQRIVAHHATVPLSALDGGGMSDSYWERISTGTHALTDARVYLESEPSQSLAAIRSAVSRVRRKHDDLALIVVDYLQLVEPRDRRINRTEQIGEISRGLKLIARESNATVVAMAQLNRASIQRPNARPALSDLRESGSIEADADTVILLHREDLEDGTPGTHIDVLVEKNRSGPRGITSLMIQGNYSRLVEEYRPPTSTPNPFTPPDTTGPRRLHAVD